MKRRLGTLYFRLLFTYLAVALLGLGITGLVFSRALTSYAAHLQRERSLEMLTQAQLLAKESKGTPAETRDLLARTFPTLDVNLIHAYSLTIPGFGRGGARPDGRGGGASFRLGGEAAPPREESFVQVPPPEGTATTPSLFSVRPNPGLLTARVIFVQESALLTITPKATRTPLLSALYREIGLVLLIAAALAALVAWRFAHWLARPVNRLTAATAAVAGGDFLQQVPPTGTPELDRLAEQFNRMVARLDESFRSLAAERDLARRFAGDAAHELKTPLTALRAFYELAEASPERGRQVLEPMGRQIDRIERIMAGLLQLAALSEGTAITLSTGNLARQLAELGISYRVLAQEAGHRFDLQVPEGPVWVRLEPRLVELAITNLVENACKFTPAGGAIGLVLTLSAHEALISVTDTGPGIAPDEQQRIFERFHRGIETQEIPGSGLGLSIVQEAVRRLGGTVGVESQVGSGSRFTIRLPLVTLSEEA